MHSTVDKMKTEIMDHMSQWIKTFERIGAGSEVDRIATARLCDFQLDMTTSGLSVLTDKAYELKAADEAWRSAYPEKAERERIE